MVYDKNFLSLATAATSGGKGTFVPIIDSFDVGVCSGRIGSHGRPWVGAVYNAKGHELGDDKDAPSPPNA
jgi:hypothetical protein